VEALDFIPAREGPLDYGYIRGNETVVFIKAGVGGEYRGFENKYLRIARLLHERHGCTVISASNPYDKCLGIKEDADILARVLSENGIQNPALYFFGSSGGCQKGLALAASGVPFRRMILVNMPLTINFHKTKRHLLQIPDSEIVAVLGEKDISRPYAPLLEGKREGVRTVTVKGADHVFTGMTEAFVSLSEGLI
jgi:hypothetical protein